MFVIEESLYLHDTQKACQDAKTVLTTQSFFLPPHNLTKTYEETFTKHLRIFLAQVWLLL